MLVWCIDLFYNHDWFTCVFFLLLSLVFVSCIFCRLSRFIHIFLFSLTLVIVSYLGLYLLFSCLYHVFIVLWFSWLVFCFCVVISRVSCFPYVLFFFLSFLVQSYFFWLSCLPHVLLFVVVSHACLTYFVWLSWLVDVLLFLAPVQPCTFLGHLPIKIKIRLYSASVYSLLSFGCETWKLTDKTMRRLKQWCEQPYSGLVHLQDNPIRGAPINNLSQLCTQIEKNSLKTVGPYSESRPDTHHVSGYRKPRCSQGKVSWILPLTIPWKISHRWPTTDIHGRKWSMTWSKT